MISVFTLIKATPVISVGNRASSPFSSCCLVLLCIWWKNTPYIGLMLFIGID